MHDLTALTEGLQVAGIRTHIETSGTHPLTGSWDWVTFSPKRFKAPLDAIYEQTDELKVVVVNRQDLEWGREHASRLQVPARWYFQPEWDRREQVLDYTVVFVQENPEWRISLQTHKYLGLP
jgi:organic radical activating enzyme